MTRKENRVKKWYTGSVAFLLLLSLGVVAEPVSYRQVGPVKDESYANVKRISALIVVPSGLSERELRALLKDAAISIGKRHDADAAVIWAYRPQDATTGPWTAGSATYAPNGRWEDAGDASPMRVSVEVGKLYFERQDAKTPQSGDKVTLSKSGPEPISLSRAHNSWGDDKIIAKVPRGTEARIIERYQTALTPNHVMVRYFVTTEVDGQRIQGWVFNYDVKPYTAKAAPRPVSLKRVQEMLQANGFNPGPVDGVLGKQTKQALLTYQIKYGLPVTGTPNAETLKALGLPEHEYNDM